ncbi:hypothetical protein ACWGIU_21895 [Streptomyces sp. NPDC054840]
MSRRQAGGADPARAPGLEEVLRVRPAHDARLGPVAAATGVSVPGARKRPTRARELAEDLVRGHKPRKG